MNITKAIFVFAALLAISIFNEKATAGSVSGPYVIWVNFGKADKHIMNTMVKNYLESGDDVCWKEGFSTMYVGGYPAEMTDTLIRDGVILKKKSAIEKLNKLLTQFSTTWDGYDGIIVYTDQDGPKLTSITAKSKKIKSSRITNIHNVDDIRFSLCSVMPPITRRES